MFLLNTYNRYQISLSLPWTKAWSSLSWKLIFALSCTWPSKLWVSVFVAYCFCRLGPMYLLHLKNILRVHKKQIFQIDLSLNSCITFTPPQCIGSVCWCAKDKPRVLLGRIWHWVLPKQWKTKTRQGQQYTLSEIYIIQYITGFKYLSQCISSAPEAVIQ